MTKYELKQCRYIGKEIEQLQEEINSLRSRLMSPSGKIITWAPTAPRQTDKFADTMAHIDEIEHELQEKIVKYTMVYQNIEHTISSIDDSRIRVLFRSRYIQGRSRKEICKQLNYSYRQVQYLHKQGLKMILHL